MLACWHVAFISAHREKVEQLGCTHVHNHQPVGTVALLMAHRYETTD